MKISECVPILAGLVFLVCAAAAQAAPANSADGIAVVDVQKIFNESKPGKAGAAT